MAIALTRAIRNVTTSGLCPSLCSTGDLRRKSNSYHIFPQASPSSLNRDISSAAGTLLTIPTEQFSRYHFKGGSSWSQWRSRRTKLLCVTAGSCFFLAASFQSVAHCSSRKQEHLSIPSNLPHLTLYQYKTCPFCSKARAYLDYHAIPYKVVEVDPILKRGMKKFTDSKTVPVLVSDDGVQISDSSLLISVLHTFLVNNGSANLSKTLDMYPEMTYDLNSKTQTERANKYFIMYGEKGDTQGVSLAERREEREWREWVDNKLVRVLPPNIYRTFSESLQSFDYMSSVGNFSSAERTAVKYAGAVSMYFIAGRLKKKYKLKEDVRQSLYDLCEEWMRGIGKDRKFMGGDDPNLADLAVYGVLSSLEGFQTFTDMMEHTTVGSWYSAMKDLVSTGISK